MALGHEGGPHGFLLEHTGRLGRDIKWNFAKFLVVGPLASGEDFGRARPSGGSRLEPG